MLSETGETTHLVLSKATTADLDETFDYRGQSVTRRWAVLHTLEHIGQHLGHLTLTKAALPGPERLGMARGKLTRA